MANFLTILVVNKRLNNLASVSQNRAHLIGKDKTIPGLSLFLKHEDPQVVYLAVECFYYLTLENSLLPILSQLKEEIQTISKHSLNNQFPKTQEKASQALSAIQSFINASTVATKESVEKGKEEGVKEGVREEGVVKRKVFSTRTNVSMNNFTTRGKVLGASSSSLSNQGDSQGADEKPVTYTLYVKQLFTRETQSRSKTLNSIPFNPSFIIPLL